MDKDKEEIRAIRELVDILNSQQVKWWIDHGTLLGFVREGKPIDWDKDFDIGTSLSAEEVIEKILPLVKKAGYASFFDDSCDALKIELKSRTCDWTVDIACYAKIDSQMIKRWPELTALPLPRFIVFMVMNFLSGGIQEFNNPILRSIYRGIFFICYPMIAFTSRNFRRRINIKLKKYIPLKINSVASMFFEEFCQCNYAGIILNQPKMAEEYLRLRYGDDWQTPKKDWNYLQDDGGIKK
jgi:hypothetical protein